MPPALHPDLTVLSVLVGSWSGDGAGEYPTIDPFSYSELLTFHHIGTPVLGFRQRTAALDDGRPMHAESGYLRLPAPGTVEAVLSQPTGIVEVHVGVVGPTAAAAGDTVVIDLRSTLVGCTPSATAVTRVERTLEVTGDVLRTTLRMAAAGQPLQHHLAATLHRV